MRMRKKIQELSERAGGALNKVHPALVPPESVQKFLDFWRSVVFPSICYFDSDMIFIKKQIDIMMAYDLEPLYTERKKFSQ